MLLSTQNSLYYTLNVFKKEALSLISSKIHLYSRALGYLVFTNTTDYFMQMPHTSNLSSHARGITSASFSPAIAYLPISCILLLLLLRKQLLQSGYLCL